MVRRLFLKIYYAASELYFPIATNRRGDRSVAGPDAEPFGTAGGNAAPRVVAKNELAEVCGGEEAAEARRLAMIRSVGEGTSDEIGRAHV